MAKPLEFGIAYHKAMEVLYNPETWDWDRTVVGELAVKAFVDACVGQMETYLRDSGRDSVDPEVKADYDERIELGKGMLRYYYQKQLPKHPEGFRPIKVEVAFEVPINHPDGTQVRCKCSTCFRRWFATKEAQEAVLTCNERHAKAGNLPCDPEGHFESTGGLPVVYAGRIDAIGEDENGDYWIIDWKTAAQIKEDDEEFLELDDQIGSYVWALFQVLGLNVRGFIYHQQRKGFPRPPQRNKHLRLGCAFSVSKSQETDYETFLATVQEEDTEAYKAGLYDNFLRYLREDGVVYFKRNVVIKTPAQLRSIEQDIYLETLDMIDPSVRIYRNAGRFSCKYCAFRQPCLGRARGEDYTYGLQTLFKKELPYYYRQQLGASTESKGGE
jgi:hypothetical protein